MGDHHAWMLAIPAVLFFDVGSYGIREWLAVIASLIGIGGYVFGIWRAWRYSKAQIAARLLEYLQDEEATIREARYRIIRRLRRGEPLGAEIEHDFYREVKEALDELANDDPRQAEKKLHKFEESLAGDIKLGQKYLSNASLQLATVLLVRGKSANERSEVAAARTAWEAALQCNSQDAEAERYLGELDLAGGGVGSALERFGRAYVLAPDDKLLKAETWESVAVYYRQQGRPKLELGALDECAPSFAEAGAHSRAAGAYARAGELAAQLNHTNQAPELLREAFENYRLSSDQDGMRATRENLENLGEDVSDLPRIDQVSQREIPWFWIRLVLELSILGAAAYLFYLMPR